MMPPSVSIPCSARTPAPPVLPAASVKNLDRARGDTEPKLLICDEPVVALDVPPAHPPPHPPPPPPPPSPVCGGRSQPARRYETRYGSRSSHRARPRVVKNVSDRVVVMYLGKISRSDRPMCLSAARAPVQIARGSSTRSVPTRHPPEARPRGSARSPRRCRRRAGCRFRTRCRRPQANCPRRNPRCRRSAAAIVACHFPLASGGDPPHAERLGPLASMSGPRRARLSRVPKPRTQRQIAGRTGRLASCGGAR